MTNAFPCELGGGRSSDCMFILDFGSIREYMHWNCFDRSDSGKDLCACRSNFFDTGKLNAQHEIVQEDTKIKILRGDTNPGLSIGKACTH